MMNDPSFLKIMRVVAVAGMLATCALYWFFFSMSWDFPCAIALAAWGACFGCWGIAWLLTH